MLVINKIDAENVKFLEVYQAIRDTFGKGCVLFNAPVNPGPNCSGVVSVLTPPASPPPGCPVDLGAARSQLLDAVVEADDALMEKFFGEGDLSADEIVVALPNPLAAGTVIPVFGTSARKGIGIPELLDALADFALSPTQARPRVAHRKNGEETAEVELKPDAAGEFVGQVFKNVSDKFV